MLLETPKDYIKKLGSIYTPHDLEDILKAYAKKVAIAFYKHRKEEEDGEEQLGKEELFDEYYDKFKKKLRDGSG